MNLTTKANRQIDYIVVHHAATPNDRPLDAAEIHTWHLQRKFSGIGYNYVVLNDGEVQSGRPEYWVGAHAKGHNTRSIGVCITGTGEPHGNQRIGLLELLNALMERYPGAALVGHRDLDPTSECPGFDVALLEL